MPSRSSKRPLLALAAVAGLLAAATPAHAGIAIGNPPGTTAPSVISPRDQQTGQPTGVAAPGARQPAALLDMHMEI